MTEKDTKRKIKLQLIESERKLNRKEGEGVNLKLAEQVKKCETRAIKNYNSKIENKTQRKRYYSYEV
jgi:hypothetical protein